jgi:hypothetical protein
LKNPSLSLFAAAAAVLAGAIVAVSLSAQAPQPQASQAPAAQAPAGAPEQHPGEFRPSRNWPAPTNLKVLPKNLTGQQVRDIMEGWAGALGTHCDHCHTPDPKNLAPNGHPRMNFADDSKPEKSTARLMYKMTQDIDQNYLSMVDESGPPVACGTCHRGHVKPEKFVPPPEEHHEGPRPGAPAAPK